MVSLVRASIETLIKYFLDALEGTREASFLGELFGRRAVLTDLVPPPRCTLRPDARVICSGSGFDRFNSFYTMQQ